MIVPRFPQDRCVILADAGVETLLACAMAAEQQQLAASNAPVLLPAWWGPGEELDMIISAVDPAIAAQASAYGLDIFPEQAVYPPEDFEPAGPEDQGLMHSRMLLEAAHLAMKWGIRRVVWPVRAQSVKNPRPVSDLTDEIATLIDRALLASRLASLDATTDTAVDVVIETPFVDLSNEQIAELVLDLAPPLETCWWHDARSLPGADAQRAHWGSIAARWGLQIENKPGAARSGV